MRDMYEVLSRWGEWARDNKGVGYSSIAAGFKGLIPQQSSGKQPCSDNDGLMIDGCVAKLLKFKPEEYELVMMHHFHGQSLRSIARDWKCSDGTVRKVMQTAEGFVGGCLAILDVKLDMD
ncbi:antitermination protein [Serratia fonticola]|uniref:antiterminator Q family protein n=1 Tax=Serratia fonticola TaxID=47917 RepID=UPI0015768946|nr:antiterminator Q family protein [Serratia fonticola]NTY85543.1 antitermination protein [Serratia fonticola]NTZ11614.1 antitermination protein [Serratia fonticola]